MVLWTAEVVMSIETHSEYNALEEAQKIYADISSWLNFCEIKHAGMFAAYIALFIAVLQLEILRYEAVRAGVLLIMLFNIAIHVASFFPFLNRNKYVRYRALAALKNILKQKNRVFYQSIFVQSNQIDRNVIKDIRENYKKFFLEAFSNCSSEDQQMVIKTGSLLDNYLDQVVEVSVVASVKAYLFEIACKLSVVTAIALAIMIICIA